MWIKGYLITPRVSSLSEPFIRHLGEKAECVELLRSTFVFFFFVTKLNSVHHALKEPEVEVSHFKILLHILEVLVSNVRSITSCRHSDFSQASQRTVGLKYVTIDPFYVSP